LQVSGYIKCGKTAFGKVNLPVNPKRPGSRLPLSFVALLISFLFVVIYTVVLMYAKPGHEGGHYKFFPDSTKPSDTDSGVVMGTSDTAEPDAGHGSTYIYLAVGKDEISGLADVIMLISFDTENLKINIVQIPRDTYFNCTRRTYKKINGAIGTLGGIDKFAAELEAALGIKIDHTVEFTLSALGELVDLVGGVTVNIPHKMEYSDPDQNLYIYLEPGEHLLDGDKAKQFVRYRSGYARGDIDRIDAQKIFMAAFIDKMTTVNILKLPAIIKLMLNEIKTDMNFSECLSFAKKALSVKLSDVVMLTMPGCDIRTEAGTWYYIINRRAAISVVNSYLCSGNAPVASEQFDAARRFTNESYPDFEAIYYDCEYNIEEHRADEVNEKGITIPVTDQKPTNNSERG
jgi:LCP family protein required for cell wall assembly